MAYQIRPLVEQTNTVFGEYETVEQAEARMKTLSVLVKSAVVWCCMNSITQKVEALAYQGELFAYRKFARRDVLQV